MALIIERVGVFGLEVERLLGGVFGQFDDRVDHRLEAFVGEDDAAQHLLFGQLLDFGFDHHHRVFGAGDDEVDLLRLRHLVEGGVQHVFAVDDSRRARRRSGP